MHQHQLSRRQSGMGVPFSAGDSSMNLLHDSNVEKCAKKPMLLAAITAMLEYLYGARQAEDQVSLWCSSRVATEHEEHKRRNGERCHDDDGC